ncbi:MULTISPECIES: hypothetical protein [unclassified Methylobacterium]|uniref:hypothetical protein n=1 Tax=unclassified Methylobacterium TaxID=2615210 RepID=UPI0011C1E1ED|nr:MULTISPECIES: hypothetical protein [unclassified Methylobacterium]QEE40182.1 hypothetical protein FVA80_15610 [Methylobacterium sp. WL1]TXN58526.1 hypothetical protein FV241_06890 [Methylobacterium sp. WL2]
MLNADPLLARPKLVNATLLAHTLDGLRPQVRSSAEMWRVLTDHYVVDLDDVAALLPAAEPETQWLSSRD